MTPRETVWPLEPHTKAKHDLLQQYLGAWFPLLSWNGRVVFLDGFAGPGVYSDGEPGSPVIALDTLLEHPLFGRWKTEFVFLFLEPHKQRFQKLQAVLNDYTRGRGGLPKNVRAEAHDVTFEESATSILDMLDAQQTSLAPTFAFIDPFGFSGVPLHLISRLLVFPRCEVFFNFMFDHVNRFITVDKVADHLEALFGSDQYRDAAGLFGEERKMFLHDLYQRQLRESCGFDYVQSFEMIGKNGHTGYYLFYGTRHLRGLEVMKDAMWRVDPAGGLQFSDRLAGQDVLFGGSDVDTAPLRTALLEHFAGQEVTVGAIEEFTLVQTPYAASHWNRKVLAPLEKEAVIEVAASPRKKRYTFPAGTVVRFP
jgi:three-Cys-motif partner protein